MRKEMSLIFELSSPGRKAYSLPSCDVPKKEIKELLDEKFLRKTTAPLPEVSETDVVRHYVSLSHRNHSVDSGFYPLGSCTMKYNPKVNEEIAKFEGFSTIHPYQPVETVQGCLQVMYDLQCMLAEITGMDAVSLQPAAGAHGELTGLMMIKAYHKHRGDVKRTKILVPDSAHGTNPASAAMAGFEVLEIPSNDEGLVNVQALRSIVNDETAGLMLTNPNTLGLFEKNIVEISDIVHKAGGLLYYDGANLNAIMGITRPGDMGFDIAHLNLHKTFSTPHGAGGPGSGPVAVKKELAPFLPYPVVDKAGDSFILNENLPLSIGKVKLFYGQFSILLRAYCYILSLGSEHLKKSSQYAVLNANYLKEKLKNKLSLPYDTLCMHEFVLSASNLHDYGVSAMDIAKRMLDEGIHPPTVYFPLIVKEAMMIEPTETESLDSLNQFVKMLTMIILEAKTTPNRLKESPKHTVVGRLNDTLAARKPIVSYKSN